MPGTVKSELLPDADRLHKCDSQEKVCEMQHLPLDKSHFITVLSICLLLKYIIPLLFDFSYIGNVATLPMLAALLRQLRFSTR